MMVVGRQSPGACPICGASHTACSPTAGAIVITQTPARDGVAHVSAHDSALAAAQAKDPNAVSTKTYRGQGRGRR